MSDTEDLIARLSGRLDPHDRSAFRRAAENALATEPACSGEGATYRVISKLWRSYLFQAARRYARCVVVCDGAKN